MVTVRAAREKTVGNVDTVGINPSSEVPTLNGGVVSYEDALQAHR